MKDTTKIKEHIMDVTTQLIEQHNGDTKSITARLIAQKAGIGLGLINYHFQSKENLITACVQKIIKNVISEFNIKKEYSTDKERLTAWAAYVFEFLFEHPAISRISILSDLQNYSQDCNSVQSQRGFIFALQNDTKDKPLLSFILTAAMQVAFLGSDIMKDLLGYDFTNQSDRTAFIEKTVSLLFEQNTEGVLYE